LPTSITVLTVLAMTLVGLFTNASSAEDRRLRVMTYNIHHAEGEDKKLDVERIAKVITAQKPDLVAVQEVDVNTQRTGGIDEAAELGRLTGMHVVFGKAMDYQGGQYGQAILSRYPIKSHTVHRLPGAAGKEPRIAVEARIATPAELAPEIRFVGTHLDHVRDDTDRAAQVKELNRLFVAADAPLTVLAGDLNAAPDSRPMDVLLEHWNDAREEGKPAEATIPATQPNRKIDWVLLPKAARWRTVATHVVDEPVASDHRPVVADLRPQN
jgi:endonuclease/exonuclease/phosphatase family metal-dependent hydrolase